MIRVPVRGCWEGLSPSPTLGERGHRGLARLTTYGWGVPIRPRAPASVSRWGRRVNPRLHHQPPKPRPQGGALSCGNATGAAFSAKKSPARNAGLEGPGALQVAVPQRQPNAIGDLPVPCRDSHFTAPLPYLPAMLYQRTVPAGFIAPCLPTKTDTPPSGGLWLHEIKHDGFRVIARKEAERVRLYSRPGKMT
jgi:hypothetical protein